MSILSKVKKYMFVGALTLGCLGYAAIGYAEAKAIGIEAFRGGYTRTENYSNARFSAWMNGQPMDENSWGEFVIATESGMDGSMTYNRYIGNLTTGQTGSKYYFIVQQAVKRQYSSDGNLQQVKRDTNIGASYEVLYRSDDKFVLKLDGKALQQDITGEYNLETDQVNMSQDAAVFYLEMHANQSSDIPLQPWKHKYKYVTHPCTGAYYDVYKRVMDREGRPDFNNGTVIEVYEENGMPMGTYMVTSDGHDIVVSNGGQHKIAWSVEAVG